MQQPPFDAGENILHTVWCLSYWCIMMQISYLQYIPWNMHMVWLWLYIYVFNGGYMGWIYPYSSWLLHWYWGNHSASEVIMKNMDEFNLYKTQQSMNYGHNLCTICTALKECTYCSCIALFCFVVFCLFYTLSLTVTSLALEQSSLIQLPQCQ